MTIQDVSLGTNENVEDFHCSLLDSDFQTDRQTDRQTNKQGHKRSGEPDEGSRWCKLCTTLHLWIKIVLFDYVQNDHIINQQFQVLEGFGGRCGWVKVDGEDTSSARMDKVLVNQVKMSNVCI